MDKNKGILMVILVVGLIIFAMRAGVYTNGSGDAKSYAPTNPIVSELQ